MGLRDRLKESGRKVREKNLQKQKKWKRKKQKIQTLFNHGIFYKLKASCNLKRGHPTDNKIMGCNISF